MRPFVAMSNVKVFASINVRGIVAQEALLTLMENENLVKIVADTRTTAVWRMLWRVASSRSRRSGLPGFHGCSYPGG